MWHYYIELSAGPSLGSVKKFELTDDEYGKRSGTAREFLNKLKGQRPDLFTAKSAAEEVKTQSLAANELPFPLGSRCEIQNTSLRGTVAWIGQISSALRRKQIPVDREYSTNIYCGIRLDEPFGNFDGKDLDGKILFECDCPRRGILVHMNDLNVGDSYTPIDPFEMDEV